MPAGRIATAGRQFPITARVDIQSALEELVRGTLYKSAMGYRFWAGRRVVVDTPEAYRRVEELLAGLRADKSGRGDSGRGTA